MSRKFANVISLLLIAGAIVAGVIAYPNLPEQVPTHWNAAGQIDDYSSRLTAVVIGPAIAAGIMLLMWLIPVISPKGFRTEGFQGVINVFQVVLVAFMVGIGGLIIAAGLGREVSIERIVPIAVGLLFIVLGNYMGKIRKNFFIGIVAASLVAGLGPVVYSFIAYKRIEGFGPDEDALGELPNE